MAYAASVKSIPVPALLNGGTGLISPRLKTVFKITPWKRLGRTSAEWPVYFSNIFVSREALLFLEQQPQALLPLCKARIRSSASRSSTTFPPLPLTLYHPDETNSYLAMKTEAPTEAEPVPAPIHPTDKQFLEIAFACQHLKDQALSSEGFTSRAGSTSRIQNHSYVYQSGKNRLHYVSSDLFESYELFLRLNDLCDLSLLTGLEAGSGFGEISAIMALFCSSVLMVEINSDLFAWAQRLFAELPTQITERVVGINQNVKTSPEVGEAIKHDPVCFYDYTWLNYGPDFTFAPGSIIISANKCYSSLQLHNQPLTRVFGQPHSTTVWKKLSRFDPK